MVEMTTVFIVLIVLNFILLTTTGQRLQANEVAIPILLFGFGLIIDRLKKIERGTGK